MTPKEKSKELINKFTDPVRWRLGQENVTQRAKECALIAVDEILSMGIMSDSGNWRMAKSYWEEVKQEIEKL
jgi:hypothetical protein